MKQRFPEKLFPSILENAPAIIAFHDRNQEILWANRAYGEAVGLTLEQIV